MELKTANRGQREAPRDGSARLTGEKAERIVDAMRRCVAERGISGATFEHVSREAGVSRGLLHYYFGTKERLLIEVLRSDADLGVAADDLDQEPLLGAEVVVEQAAADACLAGDVLEGRAGDAALGDAGAHRVDDPGRLFARELTGLSTYLHRTTSLGARGAGSG